MSLSLLKNIKKHLISTFILLMGTKNRLWFSVEETQMILVVPKQIDEVNGFNVQKLWVSKMFRFERNDYFYSTQMH